MDKKYLDKFYNNMSNSKEYDIFALSLPIALIHKKMYQETESFLKDNYDLLHSDIDVLATLYFNENKLSPTELYNATVFSSGGMTKVLKKLQNRALISRMASSTDKRIMFVCLTLKGEELIKECLYQIARSREEMFSNLSQKEKEDLKKNLSKITYSFVE
ncbi:MAG: MarR family transcriptional regulator [Aliarcobacter sp.]|nr:MarR family transcriptional regulator [Aliarcobacter sp.]